MAGYVTPKLPHPTGMRREDFEERRRALGLTPSGFKEDGTDPAGEYKRELTRKLYRRADDRLPEGLGGSNAPQDDEAR